MGIDGGYLLGGETGSNDGDISFNHGQDDLWLIKIDEFGDIEWEKTYGGSFEELAKDIEITSDGNYIIVGEQTLLMEMLLKIKAVVTIGLLSLIPSAK